MRLLLLLLLPAVPLSGQSFGLQLRDAENGQLLKLNYPATAASKEARDKNLNQAISYFWERGYLTATTDSVINRGDTLIAFVDKGRLYSWSRLYNINVDEGLLSRSGFRERLYRKQRFNHKQTFRVLHRVLEQYENNGYPFASLYLDSIRIENETVHAGIRVEPGELFVIDSLRHRGNARITPRYLQNYLGIKPGDIYNEALLRQISTRLKEVPFVTESQPAEVLLLEKSALVRLYLNERKASNFSGMLGFLPNNEQTGKLLLTGEANLRLRNSLGRGESIDAEWRRLQVGTQSINLALSWPFLFNTPFGTTGTFALFKKDTSFINLHGTAGIQYLMKGTDYLKAYVENRTSNLISTRGLENVTVLPDYADIRSNMYGLELSFTRLDYRLNPRKGIRLLTRAGAGKRTIRPNAALKPELYENLTLNSLQLNGSLSFNWFVPLQRRATMLFGLLGNWLDGPNLFENELARIGGINSLRGFDDESIFASTYGILNFEFRYLFEENSFLFLFWNGGYYENKAINRDISDTPYGFGAGMSFQTKAGIFSISYALGRQFGNPVDFRAAKVHFGITSLF